MRTLIKLSVLLLFFQTLPVFSEAQDLDDRDYKLGVADRLRVNVFGEDDLSGEYEIGSRGAISLPLIGRVDAEDLTIDALEQRIEDRFRDGYLINPDVSIEVLNYRPFSILGEVNDPDSYPYENGMTVLKAVAGAGGFTDHANEDDILLYRADEDEPPSRDGGDDTGVSVSLDTPLLPGDIVEVVSYRPFSILGEVNDPDSYPYENGMTVLKAVALAGGFTYRADEDDILLYRADEDEPPSRDGADDTWVPVSPDTPLLPGDIVRVEERFF